MSDLHDEIRQRLERLELPFNAAGIDPYGVSKRHLQKAAMVLGRIYHNYFTVECRGIENVPARGRAMLVANHSGGYAVDATMLAAACFFELEPPRLAHGMADRFMAQMPFVSEWAVRVGQVNGLPQHARRLLNDERLLMVFPEGTRGTAKLFSERYELVKFGSGFVRLAMETGSPIVPTAVLGGGEAVPTIKNLHRPGRLLGMPYIPITPYLVALPLPVRIMILFGEPLTFVGSGQEDDRQVGEMVDRVKAAIAELVDTGRKDYKWM